MAATLSLEEEQVGPDVLPFLKKMPLRVFRERSGSRPCTWTHFCRAHCGGNRTERRRSVGEGSGKPLRGSRSCCSDCTSSSSLFGVCVLRKRPSWPPVVSNIHAGVLRSSRCGGMEALPGSTPGPRGWRAGGEGDSLMADFNPKRVNVVNKMRLYYSNGFSQVSHKVTTFLSLKEKTAKSTHNFISESSFA